MGESQSRYSIIERLTTRKLEIMESKLKLKDEIKRADQKKESLKN